LKLKSPYRGEQDPSPDKLTLIKKLADSSSSASSDTSSSTQVARKSNVYPNLNELSAEAEPVIYKEKNKNKDKKTASTKRNDAKAAKKSTTRLKIDMNNPCASCPALKTKDSRFVDGDGT
jgi:hypothetical protein